MKKIFLNLSLSFFLLVCLSGQMLVSAELPKNIKWQTASHKPFLSSSKAKKGGTYRNYISSYPSTFRLYGPNSNSGGFVGYNRGYSFWSLVTRHPNTSKFLPELATHWHLAKDQKTAYFKLDKQARWSDGKMITADDYLFNFEFLKSKFIQAPFYNQYIRENIAAVEKIDDYTIKVVSAKPSWRLLEIVNLSPTPKHAVKLDKDWVKRTQWQPNVVPGPYVLKKFKKNQFIEFHRIKDWWGKDRAEYKNKFNFDVLRLDVVRNEAIAYELFKKNKLSVFYPTEVQWVKETDFIVAKKENIFIRIWTAIKNFFSNLLNFTKKQKIKNSNIDNVQKGDILKHKYPIDVWTGIRGIMFNTQDKIWSDSVLRKALAYTIDFEQINKNQLYSLNQRKNNFFDVDPPYKIKRKTYGFDLQKSNQILEKAGWKRSSKDGGIRYKDGEKLTLRVFYGSSRHNPYLGTIKNNALKSGINLELVLQDGAAFFQSLESGNYQAVVLFFGAGRYPSPRQFLHTENKKSGTNNIFLFGNKELDQWIDTYEFDLNEKKRISAIQEIEKFVHENTLLIHFWKRPFQLFLRHKQIQAPPSLGTKRGIDYDLLWYAQ